MLANWQNAVRMASQADAGRISAQKVQEHEWLRGTLRPCLNCENLPGTVVGEPHP